MAQQILNVGTVANDNTGDTLRAAMQKVQSNFDEIYTGVVGGGITYTVHTASLTATNKQGIIANTSGGTFNITLPATPSAGFTVAVIDGYDFSITAVTILRNGSTIDSVADDMSIDIKGAHVMFIYNGSTWESILSTSGYSAVMDPGVGAFTTLSASGDTTLSGSLILPGGTANGVPYLNGTKVVTTGTALTFDGTTLVAPGFSGPIGATPASGAFTTVSATGQITSTLATGTAPFVIASTTNVPNLNASSLNGATFAAPGPIGSTTASTGAFTTLNASSTFTLGNPAYTGSNVLNGRINLTTSNASRSLSIDSQNPATGAVIALNATATVSAGVVNNFNGNSLASAYGFVNYPDVVNGVTSYTGYYNQSYLAASTAITNYSHFYATHGTLSAGATISTMYGFRTSSSIGVGTTNYGFYGNLAVGTGKWNFYAAGTAANYMAGALTVDGAVGLNGAVTISSASAVTVNSASPALTITQSGAGNALTVTGNVAATSINSTPIGGTTPAAGAFTTLSATGASSSTGAYSFGSATNYGRRLLATGYPTIYENNTEGAWYFGVGAKHYGGGTWTPDGTSAAVMIADGNQWSWYLNTGLTGGVNYSVTNKMSLTSTGLAVTGNILGGAGTDDTGRLTLSGAQTFEGNGLSLIETSSGGAQRLRMHQGSGSVIYNATYSSGTNAHTWQIANTDLMKLDASGNLLVGTTSLSTLTGNSFIVNPAAAGGNIAITHATGVASGTNYAGFLYNGTTIGSITQSGTTAVAFNTTSDHRLKENVRDADAKRFQDIRFVDFEWIDGRHDCGLIAHELQAIYPDLVIGEKDAVDEDGKPVHQQVNYIGLIPRMGVHIQKLMAQVAQLEADKATLLQTLTSMETRLAALEAK